MAKRTKIPNLELFEQKLSEIPIDYPVVVEYEDGSMESFSENGIRLYINIKNKNLTFHKHKWKSIHSETSRDQYEWWIRNLIYKQKQVTLEDFNSYYEEFNRINEELNTIAFEHDFEIVEDVNFQPLTKKVNQQKLQDELTGQQTQQQGEEEQYPF